MILQHYEFAIHCRDGLVYDGSAEFGFFHPDALTQQVGIRDATPYELTADERTRSRIVPVSRRRPLP